MTNREKIIVDIVNWLRGLDTSQLAQVVHDTFYVNFACKRCVFNRKGKPCVAHFNDCVKGLEKWLRITEER